jgi:CHAT domain-containing protein
LGESHPKYAGGLNNLALLYRSTGDYPSAEPLYRQSMVIRRVVLGESHPDYAVSLNNLAVLYASTDRESDALALMQKAAAINDRMIGQIFSIGSDQQRAGFLATLQWKTDVLLSLVSNHLDQSQAAVLAALDLVLRRKALRAEAQAAQRDAVLGGRYPQLQPRLRELRALRARIVQKSLAGPGSEGTEAHHQRLAEWAGLRDDIEKDLARQIPEMNLEQKLRAADRRAVALNLPEGVALVEFVRFRVRDFKAAPARGEAIWKPARYAAFVLAAREPDDVRMLDLGEAEPIDQMIAEFRAGVIAAAEESERRDMTKWWSEAATSPRDVGLALRVAVFDKLLPATGKHSRLLLAPDGDLARLPFEVLPGADGRHLIDDYHISYLSCGRDVLRFGAASSAEPGAPLILADPDFDLETVTAGEPSQPKAGFLTRLLGRGKKAPEAPEQPVPVRATAPRSASRHSRDLDRDRSAYHFHRLPGTSAEGGRVAAMLGVSPWLDATALEGRLKTACRSPCILHLATHGFFLPDQSDPHPEGRRLGFDFGDFTGTKDGSGRLSGPMMENPMLRSGLALAGANTWLRAGNPPEEAEDGLLTAEDVTGLDLLATELVVLSACETGLGQVHVGEGVFGLRRAFVLAGAKTLVMSLWKVPDEPTRELMEDFYGRLLAGEGRAEALRQAQLAMKAKYPAPFYWGAFICQGDPAPLGPSQPETAREGVAAYRPRGDAISPNSD